MRWVKFAVLINLLCLQLLAIEKSLKLVLSDGSVLRIPTALFFDLNYLDTAKADQLQGFSSDRRSFFLFSRLSGKFRDNRVEQILSRTEIYSTLRKQGMGKATFSVVTDGMPNQIQTRNIFRIHDPDGVFHGNLINVEVYEYATGTAVFLLLGPESAFYRLTPSFNEMVQGYSIEEFSDIEEIGPSELGGAVLLIILNLAFVWYGFHRMSQLQRESLEEDH